MGMCERMLRVDAPAELVNRVPGRYVVSGSGLVGGRLFCRYMPAILDDDNQVVTVGCGALPATDVRRPAGSGS